MKPSTIEEVRAYIRTQKLDRVDAKMFWDFFVTDAEQPWHDSYGNPVKNWKNKLRTWQRRNEKWGKPKYKCWCGGHGVYDRRDDTGQVYWLCEAHKPRHKKILPDSLTDICKAPVKQVINMGDRRTALIRQIGAVK